MKPFPDIRTGIAASAIAHLSVLMLVVLFSEVHPFGSVTAEPIAVDIVTPAEAPPPAKQEEPEPKPKPSDSFDLSVPPVSLNSPSPAAQPPAAQPVAVQAAAAPPQPQKQKQPQQKQAALSSPQQAPQPVNAPQPPATSPASANTAPAPTITAKYPDLTAQYNAMLGVLRGLPAERAQDKSDSDVAAAAPAAVDIADSIKTEFRSHLRTCSKLPGSVAPTDDVRIKVQVLLTPEGRLAMPPAGIEGNHPLDKGPALLESAKAALQACQPYTMLPAERYNEWKVLDLVFTPRDFLGG